MTHIKWTEKLLIISIIATILLNPLTSQYIVQGTIYVLDKLAIYGVNVIAAPISYIIGYIVWRMKVSKPKVNIPSKDKKVRPKQVLYK